MLNQLSVKNFALIENIKLSLNNGFTVITGETGSGKSILLGALRLILGERADYSVIRNPEEKTIVEAAFNIQNDRFLSFFQENDLDFDKETIIRREINANGKSRAFINDTPVQLSVLKDLTERLIYIHSQHHTLELKNKSFQRNILDVVADNQELLKEIDEKYTLAQSLKNEIFELKEKKSKIELEADFNTFQLEELTNLQLDKLDYEEIQNEVERGEHFEEIQAAYQLISSLINEEGGILSSLNKIKQFVKISDNRLVELMERLESVKIEIQDIGDSAEDDLSNLFYEPEELAQFVSKLDGFNSALRKHNLSNQEELVELFNQLSNEVHDADLIDELIIQKQEELEKLLFEANETSKTLSKKRIAIAKTIEKEVAELLGQLKLDGATIRFDFEQKELSRNGIDEITLYFAPNKGIPAQVIEKSASGGELSRLMLIIQFLLSQKQQLPTVIFDEIDTGVSGEVAQKIGVHLMKMGERMQLLAITHLPQVASKGKYHILVKKEDSKGITTTQITELTDKERIEEVAKMMSGDKVNEAALLNAKNLINER